MGWQEKPDDNHQSVKHPFCPFKKFCVFLHGASPESILAEREYLLKRVDELEFAMDFTNSQVKKFQERIRELEESNSTLETELSEALQVPFKKYEKKEPPENPKKLGAPFGHKGYFRQKPEQIDETIEVCLDQCPLCGSKNISPCSHTTSHIQEDLSSGRLTNTRFSHRYYWCPECKKVFHGWGAKEIPRAFIGPEARAKVSFLRHEIKVSYDDAKRTLQYFCGLTMTPGMVISFNRSQKGGAASGR